MSRSTVKFLTRSSCHLCDEARPIVSRLVTRMGGAIDEVDIDANEVYLGDFGLRIPVVLTPEGDVVAEGRIEKRALKRQLRSYTKSQ